MTPRKRNITQEIVTISLNPTEPYAIELEIKRWRALFEPDHLKIALSEALNYAVEKTRITIAGYFITNWKIYLILPASTENPERFIHQLEHYTHTLIVRRMADFEHKHQKIDYSSDSSPFKIRPFLDYQLKGLLLGEKKDAPYFDLRYWRMHDFLFSYNYCSVQNYHRCEGPVLVNSLGDLDDLIFIIAT